MFKWIHAHVKYKGKEIVSLRCVKSNNLKCSPICRTTLDCSNPQENNNILWYLCKSNQNDVYCITYLDIMLKNIKINEIQPTEAFAREVANLS